MTGKYLERPVGYEAIPPEDVWFGERAVATSQMPLLDSSRVYRFLLLFLF